MQAPKQEVFLLSWEISHLNTKLQDFGKLYSMIDLKTIDFLSQLVGTINKFLTDKSVAPANITEWNADDHKIFKGYRFMHSINCRECNQSVRTTKPGLLKHLREHESKDNKGDSTKGASGTKTVDKAVAKQKDKPDRQLEDRMRSLSIESESKRNKSKETKPEKDKQTKKPVKNAEKDEQTKKPVKNAEKDEQTKEPVKKAEEVRQTQQSGEKTENVEKMAESVRKLEKDTKEPAKTTEKDEQAKVSVTKAETDKQTKELVKKQNQPQIKEPERKEHKPIRWKDGWYTERGSLPKTKHDLTNKMKKFMTKDRPQTLLDQLIDQRAEIVNCPEHDRIVQNLEAIFKESFPKVRAYPFGSRTTGLGSKTSDLDVFLDLEGNYYGSISFSKEALKDLVQLAEILISRSNQYNKLQPVVNARTPILRAWNVEEQIDCDISFTHGLSHCNTKLIKYFFQLQPVCYRVALYVKEWANSFHKEGLNTYTLVMLTIFYFQKHGMLPSVYDLQKDCQKAFLIKHWQANFERKTLDELGLDLIPDASTEKHIIKFFQYYGKKFCFETRVVCPFLGWAPQKEDFDPQDCEIPTEMKNLQNHYDKLDLRTANPVSDLLSYHKPMTVQDPFELSHNVAKGVSPAEANKFRQFCDLSAKLLDDVINERNRQVISSPNYSADDQIRPQQVPPPHSWNTSPF